MSRRIRPRRALGCALAVAGSVAALPGVAAADAPHAEQGVALRGCLLDVHVLPDSQKRMGAYVPAGYEYAGWTELGAGSALNDPLPAATPTRAQPMLFAVSCRATVLHGADLGRTTMTLAGVAIRRRNVAPDSRTSYGNNEHHVYLHAAHTDDELLADVLSDQGLPVHYVKGMTYERTPSELAAPGRPPMASSTIDVPWRHRAPADASFGMWTKAPALPNSYGAHQHLNSFWHGPADDAIELRLHFDDAIEHYTCRQLPHCNGVWARAGSPMADFLGASERRDGVTYDHEEIAEGMLAIVPAPGSGG